MAGRLQRIAAVLAVMVGLGVLRRNRSQDQVL